MEVETLSSAASFVLSHRPQPQPRTLSFRKCRTVPCRRLRMLFRSLCLTQMAACPIHPGPPQPHTRNIRLGCTLWMTAKSVKAQTLPQMEYSPRAISMVCMEG